ncbi:hypothetical protein [Sphingomonas sp. UV9]|uniref:hypothetical protein n=1 Tax=Sphingomonas sp. UV9 TaxID=1851410 RepID=UPI001F0BEDA4|nr:hypothetical protein [Sphingomonas sp. UV9]
MIASTLLWSWAVVLTLLGLAFVAASILGRRIGDARRRDAADLAAVRIGVLIDGLADATKLPPRPAPKERPAWIVAVRDLGGVIDGPDRDRLDHIVTRWMGKPQRSTHSREGAQS